MAAEYHAYNYIELLAYISDGSMDEREQFRFQGHWTPNDGILFQQTVFQRCNYIQLQLDVLEEPRWIMNELVAWLNSQPPSSNGLMNHKGARRVADVRFENQYSEEYLELQQKFIDAFINNDGDSSTSYLAMISVKENNRFGMRAEEIISSKEELKWYGVKRFMSATSSMTIRTQNNPKMLYFYCRPRRAVDPSSTRRFSRNTTYWTFRPHTEMVVDIFLFLKRRVLMESVRNVCHRFRQIVRKLMNNCGPYLPIKCLVLKKNSIYMNGLRMRPSVFAAISECVPPRLLFPKVRHEGVEFSADGWAALMSNPAVVNSPVLNVETLPSDINGTLRNVLQGSRSPSVSVFVLAEPNAPLLTASVSEHNLRQLIASAQHCNELTISLYDHMYWLDGPQGPVDDWRVSPTDVLDWLYRRWGRQMSIRVGDDSGSKHFNSAELTEALVEAFMNDTTEHHYTFRIDGRCSKRKPPLVCYENRHTGEVLCVERISNNEDSFFYGEFLQFERRAKRREDQKNLKLKFF